MGRFIKWLLIGLGGLLGLLVAFVVVVLLVVDPNDYRDEIAGVVQEQTGRELTIEGDLGLTFFPWFGIEIGRTRLADAEGFGDEPFAAIERVQLAVSVLPLLTGELALDTIVLEQPRVRLIRNEQGVANWTQFPTGKPAAEPAPDAPAEGPGGLPPIMQTLRLEGVVVEGASVVFEDRQAGTAVTLDPFNLQLSDVQLGGPIPIEADWRVRLADGPQLDGTLEATATVARDLATASVAPLGLELTASGPSIPGGEQTVNLDGRVEADLKGAVYRVSELALSVAELTVNASAQADLSGKAPVATGQVDIPSFSPRSLLESLAIEPPATRDGDVLESMAANAEFRFADGQLRVRPLKATLDDSNLDGEALVRNFAGPAVDFRLALDSINVDRYLPPAGAANGEEAPADGDTGDTGDGEGSGGAIPTEPLRALDLDGKITIGSLTAGGADLSNVDITIKADDGRIRVHPLVAELYQGRYSGDIRLDATGEQLGVSLNEKLSGIQAEPLLTDLAGFGRLLGQGDFSLTANTKGGQVPDLIDQLKGEALFSFSDGTVKGLNVAQMLRQGMARLRGNEVSDEAPAETDFTTLAGTVRIDGGTLSNDDLNVKTPLLRITGQGSANVVKMTVDYLLTVNVVGSLEGQSGADLEALKSVPVPLRIEGALTSPSFKLALAERLEDVAAQRLEAEKEQARAKAEAKLEAEREELTQKVEEKKQEKTQELQEKAGEKLKGLFN